MPVYNEIDTINEVFERVRNVDVGMDKEIILIDDCSKDGTREILRDIADKSIPGVKVIFHETNCGKGSALRTGFEHVTGDIMLIQDADLEYDPSEYPKLIKPILDGKADVVYGSRFLGRKRPEGMAFGNFMANKFLTAISNILTGFNITDMETCYKVIKTSILKEMNFVSERFSIEPEITAKLAKKKVKLIEVPITYLGRAHNEGKKINWKDGFSAIYHIFKFRFEK
ncbi:TPA: glycosyltransferase family 2 protein [bacterium]|nr:glycosyltransferase family 2 protein [bacterium]